MAVPFDIEDRRQRQIVIGLGNVLDEPMRLLMRWPAPIDEVVGACRDACGPGAIPVLDEARVDMIAAFGRLDEREPCACRPHGAPVDVALPARDVDAVDGIAHGGGDTGMRFHIGFQRIAGGVILGDAGRQDQAKRERNRKPTEEPGKGEVSHALRHHLPD